MLEVVARGAQVLIALGGAYLLAFWFVLIVWAFRDIESRSRSIVTQVFSTLLVVLFFVPGVLLYMILRPKETLDEAFQRSLEEEYLLQDLEELPLCTSCHRYVEDDFVLCPHCHAQLREPCLACTRLVDLRWALCPYCATVQHGRDAAAVERVEAPPARWIAPGVRRRRLVEETPAVGPRPLPMVPAVREIGDEEASRPAALAAAPSSEPAPEATETARGAHSALVAGMRSIVRPLDRFRPRDAEPNPRPIPEPVTAPQRDLPHVAFHPNADEPVGVHRSERASPLPAEQPDLIATDRFHPLTGEAVDVGGNGVGFPNGHDHGVAAVPPPTTDDDSAPPQLEPAPSRERELAAVRGDGD